VAWQSCSGWICIQFRNSDDGSIAALAGAFGDYDFHFVHFKAVDSRGEDGDFAAKVKAIEAIDALIPAVEKLQAAALVITGDIRRRRATRRTRGIPCCRTGVTVVAARRPHGFWRARVPQRRAGNYSRNASDDAGTRTRRQDWQNSVPNIEEMLDEALSLGDQERWEEMADLLASALEIDPDEPYVLCWLGVAERELGNDGSAYEYFGAALHRSRWIRSSLQLRALDSPHSMIRKPSTRCAQPC